MNGRTMVQNLRKRLLAPLLALVLTAALSIPAFAAGLTESQAADAALKNAGLSRSSVRGLEVEADDSGSTYEVEFTRKSNKAEYDYEISAETGKIYEKSIDYSYKKNKSKKKIGKKAAQKKAAKFAGVSVSAVKKGSCKYSYSKKQGKYELKFTNGNYRYEIEMLAPSGKVVEYEWKVIKR